MESRTSVIDERRNNKCYSQRRNGDTDIENGLVDTVGEL